MPYDTITANGRTGIGQLTEDERSQRQAQMGALQRALQGAGGPNRGSGGLTPFSEIGGETQAAPDLADIHNAMVDARQQKQAYDASTPEGMAAGREQELFQQGNGLRGLQGDADRSAARFNNQMQEHDQNEDRAFAGVANDPVGMNGGVASDHVGMEAAFPGTGRPMDSARAPGGVATAPAAGAVGGLTEDAILRRALRNPKFDYNAYSTNRATNKRLDTEEADKHALAALQMEALKAAEEDRKREAAAKLAAQFNAAGDPKKAREIATAGGAPLAATTAEDVIAHNPDADVLQQHLLDSASQISGILGSDPKKAAEIATNMMKVLTDSGLPPKSAQAYLIKLLKSKNLLPEEDVPTLGDEIANQGVGAAIGALNPALGQAYTQTKLPSRADKFASLRQVLGY